MNFRLLQITVVLSLMLSCTREKPVAVQPPATQNSPVPNQLLTEQRAEEKDTSIPELIVSSQVISEEYKRALVHAWRALPGNQRFRKARPNDFASATWKESEFDPTYEYGEIAGAAGLVMFVVDKTLPKPKNLSVVVFIERDGNRYDLYWILRNQNLSGVTLIRLSGDVFVQGTWENGERAFCEIEWSRRVGKWTCEEV